MVYLGKRLILIIGGFAVSLGVEGRAMGRGGKYGDGRNSRGRGRSSDKGSDGSDEDYMIEEDEVEEEDEEVLLVSDEDCSYASESFGNFEWEEDEEDGEIVRSKPRRGSSMQNKLRLNATRKRKRISSEEEDGDYDVDVEADEEEEDEIYDDDDDVFTPDEVDFSDEEDELEVNNKKRKVMTKVGSTKGKRSNRNTKVSKKPLKKKGRKNGQLRRKTTHKTNGKSTARNPIVIVKSKKHSAQGRRGRDAGSDSDFVCSAASDFELTISEEEREQVREAGEFCRSLTSLRSSSSLKRSKEDEVMVQPQSKPVQPQSKPRRPQLGRKGKEKVDEPNNDVGKEICGICLSEQGKRTVRGTLNCCDHYFCFACILEWSKVESRCPLCKQRFVTISKPAKQTGIDLRNVVFQVPERDQVYQPSEEEIRGYLDPYEHVICTECAQGGDDGLMLLCDICDSPAHTYCVGLGREVPEGNWYCEGCRPIASLGSSEIQAQDSVPSISRLYNRPPPVDITRGSAEFISSSLPQRPFSQVPTLPNSFAYRESQNASPLSGTGPSTLSGRRWIHRHIQNLLSSNRLGNMAGRSGNISVVNSITGLLSSQIHNVTEPAFQHSRTPEIGTSQHAFFEGRVQDNPFPSPPNRDMLLSGRPGIFRRQMIPDSTSMVHDGSVHRTTWAGLSQVNLTSGSQQFQQQSSGSSFGSNCNVLPFPVTEGAKEQLKTMIETHLITISKDVELGYNTFKDIVRRSMHTIFAACGLEQSTSDFCPVQAPAVCSHIEMLSGGHLSLVKGCCSSCFESFVKNVLIRITRMHISNFCG